MPERFRIDPNVSEEVLVASTLIEVKLMSEASRGRDRLDAYTIFEHLDSLEIERRVGRLALWELYSNDRITLANFDRITLIEPQSTQEQLRQVT